MTPERRELNLVRALRVKSPPRLALVGSGGKTTALFRLARQLPPPVLVAGSTHLGLDQTSLADHHYVVTDEHDVTALDASRMPQEVILFTGPRDETGKLAGVPNEGLRAIFSLAETHNAPLLIEADGSRGRPLKAPAEHEPVIPPFITSVAVVVGLSGLDKPLTKEWVHRPERFASLAGISLGEQVSIETLVRVLNHPLGGLKNIPQGAERVILLNQADHRSLQDQARHMAPHLLRSYRAILVASLDPDAALSRGVKLPGRATVHAVHEGAAGVLLAAGESQRFGEPKQLLEWRGEPLVSHAARAALRAGLDPVLVVVGAYQDQVRSALSSLDVTLIENPDWRTGQSASVRVGVEALPGGVGSAVFLLADQPHIPPALIRRLVEVHAGGLAPLVAPRVAGRRANPVLFDRETFSDLLSVHGDKGGRELFDRYPVAWVDWEDPSILLDVDTPDDYRMLLDR